MTAPTDVAPPAQATADPVRIPQVGSQVRPEPIGRFPIYPELTYPSDYDQSPTEQDLGTWLDDAIRRAIYMRASDLVIKGDGHLMVIDIRIDGIMRPMYRVQGQIAQQLVTKFKATSSLATSGQFIPQETTYKLVLEGREHKARVSSFRQESGTSTIVMRLPLTGPLRTLDKLNFSSDNLALVRRMLQGANQMVMLAGPMGSGKSTTAHACLAELNTGKRTIWSIEDPVERDIPGVVQLELNEGQQVTFGELLKVLVRSDYDTLFLGEIRDHETAAAGVRQAKIGRQVLTTIHANDNVTALMRLIELAEDSPTAVLDSVRGVISQRLLARLNPNWREGMDPMQRYLGRVPVHEVLQVTPQIVDALSSERVSLAEVRDMALDNGDFSTFEIDCERLLNDGVTDEAEVRRVFGQLPGENVRVQAASQEGPLESIARSLGSMTARSSEERLGRIITEAIQKGLAPLSQTHSHPTVATEGV